MPTHEVRTPQRTYAVVVQRGVLARAGDYIPRSTGKLFVITTHDVWRLHGSALERGLAGRPFEVLFSAGGEENKRLAEVELLSDEMLRRGGDRSSAVLAFGGGIVGDVAGFLAAVFMRGIPVIQVPTTLLAQVDASVGGKTGVNLVAGKNMVGAFHQPSVVLTDPDTLSTLPEREYRAGLYEVIKCGIIGSPELFQLLVGQQSAVLSQSPEAVEQMLAESVRIKAEVVSADERESDLRRILNFGHTFGHALEALTGYARFLHGEAVGFGMKAAVHLAQMEGHLPDSEGLRMLDTIDAYGPIPSLDGIHAVDLVARLASDKKTVQGAVHFVLPERIGKVKVVTGLDDRAVLAAARAALS
jgi:3-dehydroquinate synthase